MHSLRDIHPTSSGACGDCTWEGLARCNDTLYKGAEYLTQLGASFPVRSGACMYKCSLLLEEPARQPFSSGEVQQRSSPKEHLLYG